MKINVLPSFEAMSRAVADRVVAQARQSIRERGRFTAVLSGGETPKRAYELLASHEYRAQIDWSAVHLFWGDERCVPPGDPRSNFGVADRSWLHRLPVTPLLHPITFESDPAIMASRYEKELRHFFSNTQPRFDLVLLGLGRDGHTASLFPGSKALLANGLWLAESPRSTPDVSRVTLTPLVLNSASQIAFLVSGAEKAPVLKEVLEGTKDPNRLPAQLIVPETGEASWYLDTEAARLLSSPTNSRHGT